MPKARHASPRLGKPRERQGKARKAYAKHKQGKSKASMGKTNTRQRELFLMPSANLREVTGKRRLDEAGEGRYCSESVSEGEGRI